MKPVVLPIYETGQNRFWNKSKVHLFVNRCKNTKFFLLEMFGSFGSVETKCNGASKEIYFQNEQPKHFDIFGRAPPITATLILDVFLYVSPTKG